MGFNIWSVITAAILVICIVFAVVYIVRHKSITNCNGNCVGCAYKGKCGKNKEDNK